MGFCLGIENYSRHLDGRAPGRAARYADQLLPKDYILFVDESHVSIPQISGMYRGDRSRKRHWWNRALSTLRPDNRLNFTEFENIANQTTGVSATPETMKAAE